MGWGLTQWAGKTRRHRARGRQQSCRWPPRQVHLLPPRQVHLLPPRGLPPLSIPLLWMAGRAAAQAECRGGRPEGQPSSQGRS